MKLPIISAAMVLWLLLTGQAWAQTVTLPAGTTTAPADAQKVAAPANAAGVGDLLVAPTRVVFQGRARTAELALINIGSVPATYRISLSRMRMKPTGELAEVDTPAEGELFGENLIRFSPRQVTLEPRVVQTVRVQLRLPAELAPGEYRINMLFRGVPPASEVMEEESSTGFQVRLIPIYGVSIPMFIRHGATSAEVALSGVRLLPPEEAGGSPLLQVQLNRTGNRSVYGNITVRFAPRGGREQVVGLVNGIAVYSPLQSRPAQIPLRPPAGLSLERGRLRISYVDGEQDGGAVLAETELELP